MAAPRPLKLPLELILRIADCLGPSDLLHMIQGIPQVAPLLNSRHIEAQDENGHTILYLIVEQGLENLIKPLAKWILQSSIPNNEGSAEPRFISPATLMILGLYSYSWTTVQTRPQRITTDAQSCMRRVDEILLKLIKAGAVLDHPQGLRGLTPLFYVAWLGREDAARILLEAGADPSIQTDTGETILQRAVKGNHTSVVQLLLGVGVDVGVRDFSHGWTAVLTAAHWGADDCLRLLLKAGADVLVVDYHGRNALHLAARMGNPSTVRLLLKEGVNSSAKDNQGYDPLRYAVEGEQQGGVILGDYIGVIRILEDVHKNTFLRLVHRMGAKCYSTTKS
ncbi:hypothetical protein CDV55_105756 [Aspergillus turcosus]|nr:hypothetical protein CDV55_105756 [Aspergillus turcosus]